MSTSAKSHPAAALLRRMAALLGTALWLAGSASANPLCPGKQPLQFAHHAFGSFYSDGKGIDVDLVNEMSRRSGCHIVQTLKPRSRIWREPEEGVLEMAGNGIENAQRNQFAVFIPYIAVRARLLYRGAGRAPATVAELLQQHPRLGIVRSFKHGEPYDSAVDTLRQQGYVVEARDMDQLFEWLQLGRIQAAITHPMIYQYYLPRLQPNTIQIMDLASNEPTLKVGVIVSRKLFSAAQIDGWRTLLQGMRHDGTLLQIYSHHVGADNARAALLHVSPSE